MLCIIVSEPSQDFWQTGSASQVEYRPQLNDFATGKDIDLMSFDKELFPLADNHLADFRFSPSTTAAQFGINNFAEPQPVPGPAERNEENAEIETERSVHQT